MRYLNILTLLAFCTLPHTAILADEIDDLVEAHLKKHNIPSISLAIVQNGEVVRAKGYGFADLEHRAPASQDTIYQIGSVGKMFTAACILRLENEGKLSVQDSVRKHLPEAPESWDNITIHQLLNHTSGIGDFAYGGPDKIDLRRDFTDEQLAAEIFKQSAEFKPGEKWSYNNAAYVLLGLVINRVTGEHFGEYLREHFFTPLDIKSARVISDEPIILNRASGYERNDQKELINQAWVSPTFLSTGDGSLYFTASDLAKWDIALGKGKPVDTDMLNKMWRPTKYGDNQIKAYGYGWELDDKFGHKQRGHSGGWQGFNSLYCRFPEQQTSIILLSNISRGDLDELMEPLAKQLFR